MKIEDLLLYGGIAALAYFVVFKPKAAPAAPAAPASSSPLPPPAKEMNVLESLRAAYEEIRAARKSNGDIRTILEERLKL